MSHDVLDLVLGDLLQDVRGLVPEGQLSEEDDPAISSHIKLEHAQLSNRQLPCRG